MSIIIEIRAAEGGMDAKLLVREQAAIYLRYAKRRSLTLEVLTDLQGQLVFRAEGKNVRQAFAHEPGGHRWQRIPPNERKGRVHSSTITVTVLDVPRESEFHLDPKDLEFKTCRGSGAGGQHRNVTDSAVQLKHLPSGLSVRVESERSQHQNKAQAMELLRSRLAAQEKAEKRKSRDKNRKAQCGSGMRGDKRRSIRVQGGQVVDHLTGKRMSVKPYLRGEIDTLHP